MFCFYRQSILSNFYHYPMTIDGKTFNTVEHYFQAMKATTPQEFELIRTQPSPAMAKKQGRKVLMRSDWESIKEQVMYIALEAKFSKPEMQAQLLYTNDLVLIEASPSDKYWGAGASKTQIMQTGSYPGMNRLGVLLMALRYEIYKNNNSYDAYVDGSYMPTVSDHAGWSVVIVKNSNIIHETCGVTRGPALSRNIDGEIYGAMSAIEWAYNCGVHLNLYYDYIGIGMWLMPYLPQPSIGWQAKSEIAQAYVASVKDKLQNVTLNHVHGHSGNPYNDKADLLAKSALLSLRK